MIGLYFILLGAAIVLLGVYSIIITRRVNKLQEKQNEQTSINKMIIKHLNQLLVDVDALVEDSENFIKN